MNIHFQLRSQGKRDPYIILQVFDSRFKGRKFKYSTGITITPTRWDKRKNRVKVLYNNTNQADEITINKHLDSLEQALVSYLGKHYGHTSLSANHLRTYLKAIHSQEPEELEGDSKFFAVWQSIINTTKSTSGESIASGTKRSKEQTKRLAQEFAIAKGVTINFSTIDMQFYHEFENYMIGKGLNGNTRGKHFKEIKAILREDHDRDMVVNQAYLKKSFRVIRSNTDNTYLCADEIKKLFQLELTPAMEEKRDIFAMACYLGLRHGDWHQIKESNIIRENKAELLRITQQKTKDSIHIPIHTAVRAILDKYQGYPPKVVSNQKFNEALKAIAQKADLGSVVINGEYVEKWKFISTHTARRSFATNAYLSRTMDVYQIMKCTGHKSESSFLKYLKLNGKDFAVQAADSKFFKDNSWSSLKIAS